MRPSPIEDERRGRERSWGETISPDHNGAGDGVHVLIHGNMTTPYKLASSYARALEEIGCEVDRFDTRAHSDALAWWIRSRAGRRLTQNNLLLRRAGSRARNDRFVRQARELRPDLVLIVSGKLVLPETIREIRNREIPVAVVEPDSPLPESANHRPEMLDAAREVDRYFIWSRNLGRRLEEIGVEPVHYLPFGWDPEIFPHVGLSEDFEYDVVFIGGWDEWREAWLEPVAERFDLTVWGPEYWGDRPALSSRLPNCWEGRAVRGIEAAEVIGRSRVVLNVFREQNLPDGINMRTFEVPGAGGFLLSHRTKGAVEIFPEKEGGAYFSTREEMLTQIDRYLDAPGARADIARSAHRIVDRGHSYADRAAEMLRVCDLG